VPRARGARHEFPFAIAQREGERGGKGGEGRDPGSHEIAPMCDIGCICICRVAVRYVKLQKLYVALNSKRARSRR